MTLQQILEKVKKGQLSVEHAEDLLKKEGYEEMDYAKLDITRKARTGFAEVVYCARKADEHLLNIYQKLYEEDGEDHKFKIHYELEVDLGTFLEEEHQEKSLQKCWRSMEKEYLNVHKI